jgi:phage shock protein A
MASLMEKVGTLIRANLHALIDEALKKNSVAVLDEYIRQAENNLEDLEDAAATWDAMSVCWAQIQRVSE